MGLAVHRERYGRREGELRAAVQCGELLAVQLEERDHDRSRRPGGGSCRFFVEIGRFLKGRVGELYSHLALYLEGSPGRPPLIL